jgi:hypothetical protein
MNKKLKAGFVGAIAVVAILLLQAVEHWTVIDAVMSKLRSVGPIGTFTAGIFLSPVVPLVIAIAAIYLVFEGRKEKAIDSPTSESPAKVEAIVNNSGNSTAMGGSATATGGSITQNFVLGDLAKREPPTPAQFPPKAKEKHIELTALAIVNKWIVLEDTAELWRFGSGRNVVPALLLPFYFDPIASDPVYSIEYVRAHLIFTTTTGHKILVDHGCWVDSSVDCINIHPGETRHLIVAMVAEGEYAAIIRIERITTST